MMTTRRRTQKGRGWTVEGTGYICKKGPRKNKEIEEEVEGY